VCILHSCDTFLVLAKPVKSASKKLAPNNFAPLKLACRSMDCNVTGKNKITCHIFI